MAAFRRICAAVQANPTALKRPAMLRELAMLTLRVSTLKIYDHVTESVN